MRGMGYHNISLCDSSLLRPSELAPQSISFVPPSPGSARRLKARGMRVCSRGFYPDEGCLRFAKKEAGSKIGKGGGGFPRATLPLRSSGQGRSCRGRVNGATKPASGLEEIEEKLASGAAAAPAR